ncbi:hypothetical protein KVR01_000491 [Diaporthe batatas]|uniref:uncharacterized protein n=1 Tax=Diaporthe batatas TaxID=748121 RepID=UPI001D0489AC|nr:uncharacterized protein KVR01_000491 [Diaporthe batatas]KAG8169746.1 hypothetical protein KVR01_000491 [Diaporthe batatas]
MNAAQAGRVGESSIRLLQLAGSLDGVVAVVGEYPQTWPGDNRLDQFVIHVLADPEAASGQLPADQYQFVIEEPTEQAHWVVDYWTFQKGFYSYDKRRLQFGHTSAVDVFVQAPDATPMSGYEAALQRLKILVGEAVSRGLRDLRIVISATNPQTLPTHRFSDSRAREQQELVSRCMQVCQELTDHVDLELRNVDSLRNFLGPTSSLRGCTFQDHEIPEW